MTKGQKRLIIAAIIVFAIILLLSRGYSFFIGNYNKMVVHSETINSTWAQVENQYQRRLDLIPNLVATVKGYATHESEVFTNIADARSKAGGVMQVSDSILEDPEAFKRFQQAQGELGNALQRLLVISENYPALKADQNFLALQDQLEGTENRIAVERKRFNDAVQTYNTFIRIFPRSIIANNAGFREKPYFSADAQAATAPQVSF